MAKWENLKNAVVAVVKTNGNKEITGANMQAVLNSIINAVGGNAGFAGIATPTTQSGIPDGPTFYIATQGGTYSYFPTDGQSTPINIQSNGIFILFNNGNEYWSVINISVLDSMPIAGSGNPVMSGGVEKDIVESVYLPLNNWQQGNPTTDGTSDGRTTRIYARIDNLPTGTYNFKIPDGYSVAYNFKSTMPSIGVGSGWLSGTSFTTPSGWDGVPYAFFILAKGDRSQVINPSEGYNLRIDNTDKIRLDDLENGLDDAVEDTKTLQKQLGMQLNWQQGSPTNQGISDGQTNRIFARIDNLPTGTYRFKVSKGYKIAINMKALLPSAGTSSGFLDVSECNITVGNYVFFVVKKESNGNISPAEACNVVILGEEDIRLSNLEKAIYDDGVDSILSLSWQQGSPNTDGTSDGRGTRIFAHVENLPTGEYKFELAAGYSIAINEKSTLPAIGRESHWIYGNQWTTIVSNHVFFILAKGDRAQAINPSDGKVLKVYKRATIDYQGEALPFGRGITIRPFLTIPEWRNSQGAAVYQNYLISCSAIDEIADGNPNGAIHDLTNGNKVADLEFPHTTIGGVSVEKPHANEVCFGNEFYNNSPFPLIYISQVRTDINVAGGVLVYSIASSGGQYTPSLVQVIKPDVNDAELMAVWGNYTPNYIVDTDKSELYVLNYPNASWTNLNGNTYVCKFKLPKLSDGEEITLTYADLIDSYQLPNCYGLQQSFYYAGKLYISGGFGGNANKVIRVIDLARKIETTLINVGSRITEEPQFIGLYMNHLLWYGTGTSGKIDEFIF